MTLRTLTFDDAQYKLVPVEATCEIVHDLHYFRAEPDGTAYLQFWRHLVSSIPDILPGVIEHNDEPVAWINYNVLTREERICRRPITALQPGVYTNTKLFTHPAPAPTQTCKGVNCSATDGVSHSPECFAEHDATVYGQPVERQELSDEEVIDKMARCGFIWAHVLSGAEKHFVGSLKDARAIIAKDRGQA